MRSRALAVLLVLILVLTTISVSLSSNAATVAGRYYEQSGSTWYVEDTTGELWEIVRPLIAVEFVAGTTESERIAFCDSLDVELVGDQDDSTYVCAYPDTTDPVDLLEEVLDHEDVEDAWLNELSKPLADPHYSLQEQWNLFSTRVGRALDVTRGSEEVLLAIIDTGIYKDHEDLSDVIWSNPVEANGIPGEDDDNDDIWFRFGEIVDDIWGYNFDSYFGIPNNPTTEPYPVHWHGTLVAGNAIAANDNSEGLKSAAGGGAGNRPIHLVSVVGGTQMTMPWAIKYCMNKGVNVLNISRKWPDTWASANLAVAEFISNGGIIVAASGNDTASVNTPANLDDVVAVGAVDSALSEWAYSNDGSDLDIVAPSGFRDVDVTGQQYHWTTDNKSPYLQLNPGSCVCSGVTDTNYTHGGGTSLAAPQVAGAAALLWSYKPELSASQVTQRLLDSARDLGLPGEDDEFGHGVLDVYRALSEPDSITTNTTWSGNTFVASDVDVAAGATLTIDAGTTILVANDDDDSTGVDTTLVEFTVSGSLVINGTSANPMRFSSLHSGVAGDTIGWVGINVQSGADSVRVTYAEFRNAEIGILNYCSDAVVSDAVFEYCDIGIETHGHLDVSDTEFAACTDFGIRVVDGATTLTGVTARDCEGSGLQIAEAFTGSAPEATISGGSFEGNDDYGVQVSGSSSELTLTNASLRENDFGVSIAQGSADIDSCVANANSVAGLMVGLTSDVDVAYSSGDSNTTYGMWLFSDGDIDIRGNSFSHNSIGIYCNDGSSPVIDEGNTIASNSTGIKCEDLSHATIRDNEISGSTNGIVALGGSEPDLGIGCGTSCTGTAGEGGNSVTTSSVDHVANLDTTVNVVAECNFWGLHPPKASKFYGNVDYTPSLAGNPFSVAPRPPDPGEKSDRVPTEFALGLAYPNPFNPRTTISYDVPRRALVEISVYDVSGRLIRNLVKQEREAGFHHVEWDGKGQFGGEVATGVYFVRMTASGYVQTRKLVMLK